jgi:hypothetical protein
VVAGVMGSNVWFEGSISSLLHPPPRDSDGPGITSRGGRPGGSRGHESQWGGSCNLKKNESHEIRKSKKDIEKQVKENKISTTENLIIIGTTDR